MMGMLATMTIVVAIITGAIMRMMVVMTATYDT